MVSKLSKEKCKMLLHENMKDDTNINEMEDTYDEKLQEDTSNLHPFHDAFELWKNELNKKYDELGID